MAFDGATQCPDGNCLKTKVFQDMQCGITSAELLAKYNGDITALWEVLCCIENSIQPGLRMLDSSSQVFTISYGGISHNFDTPGNYDSGNVTQTFSLPASVPTNATKVLLQAELSILGELNVQGVDDHTAIVSFSTANGSGSAKTHTDTVTNSPAIANSFATFGDSKSVIASAPISAGQASFIYRLFRQSSQFIGPSDAGQGLLQITVKIIGYE